jgi:hypothetical protein
METLDQKVARLERENAELKNNKTQALRLKISEKGGLSVYNLGRFPVTLYKEQWKKLLERSADILSYIETHDKELKTKGE